ncbi:hypothetical protein [Streptomyces albidus (ex Kaewkla and Franco 2022)]|uniref:hypothetical protein n=1 Tax=Streptomyces albidus (ex Kaewkla and Franco 2022) TaxID=722709 RepID=UPI0015EFC560|nr:hypothetical protein [Streptomyces albidus (ex Kaewkla and Franco 2022)]
MTVRSAVFVVLRGPADKLDSALARIQKAGVFADRSVRGPDVIEVYFHGGDERPTPLVMDKCASLVAKAAIGTDFVVEETGTVESNAATRQLAYDRHSGQWLGAFVNTELPLQVREEKLKSLADAKGISVDDIELRDPPQIQILAD